MTTADRLSAPQARLMAEGPPSVLAIVVRTATKVLVLADGGPHGFVGS